MPGGRFLRTSYPWIALGANCLPVLPGAKSPAVAGWGASGELAASWGFEPAPLHSEGSPKIPVKQYVAWAHQFDDHNALVLPATIGATVVDVDKLYQLDAVLEACGHTAFRTYSGREGGGVHLWYAGVTRSRTGVVSGVDVKSSGGYVIAPGSLHAETGAEYMVSPELAAALAAGELRLPDLRPDWSARLKRLGGSLRQPTRLDLFAIADKLAAKAATKTIGRRLRRVAAGDPFADPGERDGALYTLLAELGNHWPAAETEAIAQLFEASVSSWTDEDWLEKVREKWSRVTRDAAAAEDAVDERARKLRRDAWHWVGVESDDQVPLTGEPIVAHAGRAYYVRVGSQWAGPWSREDFSPDAVAAIAALYGTKIQDYAALMAGFAKRARRIDASLTASETRWVEGVLTVAVAARAAIEARYSPRVDAGLRAMAGPYIGQLNHWIAGLTRLEVPSRALMLSGPRGTGKTLLLSGLGKLWPKGASQIRHVVGKRFNDSVLESPFAIADDDTAPAESGQALAAYLRQSVSDRTQKVERKFQDIQRVVGCLRFAVATNDPYELAQGAVSYKLNDESVAAFLDRVLHVPVPETARGWWGSNPAMLVDGLEIARHAMWLAAQEPYQTAVDRFWVGPGDETLRFVAALSSGLRGDILLRLCEIARQPNPPEGIGVEFTGDHFVVNASDFVRSWVIGAPRGLTIRTAGAALKSLSAFATVQLPYQGGPRHHAVPLALVDFFAAYCGV